VSVRQENLRIVLIKNENKKLLNYFTFPLLSLSSSLKSSLLRHFENCLRTRAYNERTKLHALATWSFDMLNFIDA